jgi:nucleoside transporter
MKMKLRVMLSAMMFLQYAAWGSWMPVIGATLGNRFGKETGTVVGNVFTALWLGCMFAPFAGQLVDRLMPGQVFLGITNLLAAGAAFQMANQTTSSGLFIWMFIWAILFMPGTSITNAIAFSQIEKTDTDEASRERTFSWIRSFGTFGWVAAAFALLAFINATNAGNEATGPIREMQLTGIFCIIMGIYSFFLPNTPPTKERTDPLAFRKAFSLFRTVPGFGVFMAISFFAATEFMFFYNLSGQFLEGATFLQIPHNLIGPVKSISQIAEVGALAVLLPLWLPKKGMRWCLLLGSFAWPLRYFIFAIGQPAWLVVASLALHGFGYAFVMVVQQLYVDRVAHKDIRGSAQSLLTLVTLGLGNIIGSQFSGHVQTFFTDAAGHANWPPIFILPGVTTLICAFAYMFTFRDQDVAAVAAAREHELEASGV